MDFQAWAQPVLSPVLAFFSSGSIAGGIIGGAIVQYIGTHFRARRDKEGRELDRKRAMAAELMTERDNNLGPAFIRLLNGIPFVFGKDEAVMKALREFSVSTVAIADPQDAEGNQKLFTIRTDCLVELLKAVSAAAGHEMTHGEIRSCYTPQALADRRELELQLTARLHELLDEKRPIHVVSHLAPDSLNRLLSATKRNFPDE